jgi:phasin family protein
MAETDDSKPTDDSRLEASAEKAYAAAAEAIGDAIAESEGTKASAPAAEMPAAAAPITAEDSAEPVAQPAKPKRAAKPARAGKAAAAAVAPAKPGRRAAKSAGLAVKRAPAKSRKPVMRKPKPAAAPAAFSDKIPFIAQLKEIPMDMTSSVKDTFAKTGAAVSEYGEFAKGNVEAFVESGKILAAGLQELGSTFVADSKAAFETMTGEVKELSAVKSPTEFFKLQTELLRRNLDSAVAYGSKTSEAMLKLTNDVIAPLSGRVSLAVEKVRKAA